MPSTFNTPKSFGQAIWREPRRTFTENFIRKQHAGHL
jgi:hypothetical protein